MALSDFDCPDHACVSVFGFGAHPIDGTPDFVLRSICLVRGP